MTELQKLCDKVIILKIYGSSAWCVESVTWATLMFYISASLEQVYKGRLKETRELVAVKVQRPFVLETVTIDLFIIRNLGLVLRTFPQVSVDVVSLVDEWAAQFFEELDYVNEGENGIYFAKMMKEDLPQNTSCTS